MASLCGGQEWTVRTDGEPRNREDGATLKHTFMEKWKIHVILLSDGEQNASFIMLG